MSGRRIKIVRIITRLNIGGPAIQAVTLSAELPPSMFETTLLCGVPDAGEGDMSPLAGEKHVRPVVIPTLHREVKLADDLRSLRAVLAVLRARRPDIVHTHTSKAGLVGRTAALLCGGIKTVHTFHGNVLSGYFSPLRSHVYLLLERWLARRTDRLVALSGSQKEEMLRRYRVGSEGQYAVIPLGLDLAGFAGCDALKGQLRKELGIMPGVPVVTVVGRLVPIKDHFLLLSSARRIASEKPGVLFLIVGDGILRGDLEKEAKRLGLEDCVKFLGWRRDLERVYADSDCVVLTSRNEGTPVSLIEAAAAARPVVATDVGGVRDVVLDGVSGLIAGRRDPGMLASLITGILNDGPKARAMGEQGRIFALRRFTKERLLRDVAGLYSRSLSE